MIAQCNVLSIAPFSAEIVTATLILKRMSLRCIPVRLIFQCITATYMFVVALNDCLYTCAFYEISPYFDISFHDAIREVKGILGTDDIISSQWCFSQAMSKGVSRAGVKPSDSRKAIKTH